MNTHQPYLQVSNIRGYYGESYIVQDVSFTLEEKQVLALLGRNGAGKTSTLKCIARAEEPQLKGGEIYLQGKSMHDKRGFQASRAGIQLVPEDRRIIPGLTVEENLTLAQIAEPAGVGVGTDLPPLSAAR